MLGRGGTQHPNTTAVERTEPNGSAVVSPSKNGAKESKRGRKQKVGNSRKRPPMAGKLVLVLLMLVAVILGLLRWVTLPDPKYFWPAKAEDWSAWGTCLGAAGTILAVVYAARTLQSTTKAQLEDRKDRRSQMSFIEAKEAEEAIKLRPNVSAIALLSDEWGDGPDAKSAMVYVENYSDHAFHSVQVYVPRESLKRPILSNFKFYEAPFIWEDNADGSRRIVGGKWVEIEALAAPIPGSNLFTLGTVEPRTARGVMFDFPVPDESTHAWSYSPRSSQDDFAREMLLVVAFTDYNGKSWQRTTHDGGKIMRVLNPDL